MRIAEFIETQFRAIFIWAVVGAVTLTAIAFGLWGLKALWPWVALGPLTFLGFVDMTQKRQAIRRNFPVLGHMRYVLEMIRPEIYQYFIENDTEGVPFDREQRSLIYQRAKNVRDTTPFGTKMDVYAPGYEWVNHSLLAKHLHAEDMRVTIGGPDCKQPYSCSLLNISAMSFGSLSMNAILALSRGAKMDNFAHNTGEGGLSPYHIEGGADLIWQVGTGYFACRGEDGKFSPEIFKEKSALPNVKMIEIKLSQGAKPGHGGILPAAKVTPEIAKIRGVPMGKDVLSPPTHTEFNTPLGLLEFVKQLRDLSDGKPIGFKLCVGKRREFLAICKAMIQTGITPDFIVVDGAEGGTGAAPLEFSNHIGAPLVEGLIFVHNALVGYSLRDKVKLIASGKVTSAFGMLKRLAIGADACYSARGMMMSLGCIQALKCNSNHCPVGVATQEKHLMAGLDPTDKANRVASYHHETIESLAEMMGALGISSAEELRPWHVMHRVSSNETRHYGELYKFLRGGELLAEPDEIPIEYRRACNSASAESFGHVE